jgi:hypothetical protein
VSSKRARDIGSCAAPRLPPPSPPSSYAPPIAPEASLGRYKVMKINLKINLIPHTAAWGKRTNCLS